ncbi:MAG: hypothetical protein RJA36_705 [Pseudomonadota bacterium]|jgi:hypothetical protein
MALPYLKYPVLLAAASVLAACVVAPPAPGRGPGYEPAYGPWTYQTPPPPRVEYRGLAPGPSYVWIDGFWNWGGVRFEWVPGYWVVPSPGRVWVPPVWRRDGDRWRSDGGRWEQRPGPPAWPHREPVPTVPLPRPLPPPEMHPGPRWEPHPGPRPEFRPERPMQAPYGAMREPARPAYPEARPPAAAGGQVMPDAPRRPEAWPQRSGEPMLRPAPAPSAGAPPAGPGPGGTGRGPDERPHGPPPRRDGPQDGERDRR